MGHYYLEKRTPESLEKARDFFNRAIAQDPNFAQAYVGLADYWSVAPDYLHIAVSESLPKEKAASLQALALDGRSAAAHLALANAYCDTWDWNQAEGEFQQALRLDPNFANAHHWYGLYLSWRGQHQEGLAHLERAVELDRTNLKYNDNLAEGYLNAREYDRALVQLNKTVAMYPDSSILYNDLGDLYRAMGKYDLWLESWKKQAVLSRNQYRVAAIEQISRTYRAKGYSAAVRRIIEIKKQRLPHVYVDPADIAYEYAALGNHDKTFEWLEKAYGERSRSLQWIEVQPTMDGIRSDPRYLDLLQRMGIR
jgi:tetratricopeptide (TPR) repeat protein